MALLILASFFCSIGETAQASVNIFGTVSAMTIVIQMFVHQFPPTLTRSYSSVLVPPIAFFIILSIVVPGVVVVLVKMLGRGKQAFARWMHLATMMGGALVAVTLNVWIQRETGVEAAWPELMKASNTASAVVGFVVVYCMALLNKTTNNTTGWLATLFFMFVHLPRIWENFVHPASAAGVDTPEIYLSIPFVRPATVEGVDISQIYISMLGHGLGLARGLYIRNTIWIVGAGWSCFVGGVLRSASVLIADARLSTPFLTPLSAILLIAFNIFFLFYASMLLFCFLGRKEPMKERPDQEATDEGVEAC
jgi:hypothetical protein